MINLFHFFAEKHLIPKTDFKLTYNLMYPPINIWNNIERVYVQGLDIVFEGQTIVGIHHSDWDDAISEIDFLCKKLQQYKSELISYYGVETVQRNSVMYTYVYLLEDGTSGLFKIGRSVNPIFREKTLKAETPQIKTLFVSPQTEKGTEKELHKIFKEKRVRGEWFKLNNNDIDFIKSYNYGAA